jgi:hypothetical protein
MYNLVTENELLVKMVLECRRWSISLSSPKDFLFEVLLLMWVKGQTWELFHSGTNDSYVQQHCQAVKALLYKLQTPHLEAVTNLLFIIKIKGAIYRLIFIIFHRSTILPQQSTLRFSFQWKFQFFISRFTLGNTKKRLKNQYYLILSSLRIHI